MRILFFGTYDVRAHPRVRVLQQGFAALGDEVVECNVPLRLDTDSRVRMLRHPWLLPLLLVRLARAWWQLWRRTRLVRGRFDAVVVGYLGHFDVHFARRLWQEAPVALDHLVSGSDTALDRGLRRGRLVAALEHLDARAIAAADVPFVDTVAHHRLLAAEVRERAAVVEVGAPEEWFREPRPRDSSTLRVIFFGLFTPLQGAPTIGEAIDLLAERDLPVRFTMVGHGQEHELTRRLAAANANVRWIDWVAAERLPELVASHDVCLGIFGAGPKALRVVPNKVFQGAAAGCAIVTSDTSPQRAALGDAGIFVPPGDASALARVLADLATDPKMVLAARHAAHARAVEAFTPARVVAPLRARLAALAGKDG
ncbi:MAG TPA: glycosyltransferase [Egibacteraceae bacterium]|nr:glycosyltransferase [Egibacteraceae bacterium]